METHTFCVGQDDVSERLDVFLTKVLPDSPSRTSVQHFIEQGLVKVNDKQEKKHYEMVLGDEVEVLTLPQKPINLEPEKIPLEIFYEDKDILVVNKPSGMTVHPGAGCPGGTLANALSYHCKKLSTLNDPLRPGIVHRLDKETSGLMVVAKNNKTHNYLAKQFEERVVKKCYVALVEGDVEFDEGVIDAPLGPDPHHREKRSVLAAGAKDAKTFYKVLKRLKKSTLVYLMPRTGRMHQLRVHMAHLGHPILGDDKYGDRRTFSRLALHAKTLAFLHPKSKTMIEFTSLTPKEFK
ncbi:MAG: RluA family pseudouridine synthase [Candidatus Omnitrophica bacterium]|nr:RluA family pseudouridine synthase [Candidatus Omnitrophota bacterium]